MHKHHILPRHAGGTDDPSNLVELTVAQHAEAHRVLFEQHGRWQDRIAWLTLSGQISNEEANREAVRLAAIGNQRHKGHTHTKKTKDFLRHLQTGRPHTVETKAKMSATHTGRKKSIETRSNMSKGQRGNSNALGHKQTPEHIRNARIARMASIARRKLQQIQVQ